MKVLEGVRVLDLSQFLSGPRAAQILGFFGAEVIKIEPPRGDTMRMLTMVTGSERSLSCLHQDKKGIVLDLRNPRGRDVFLQLVDRSDVLVENFKPGTMDKLGLGWDGVDERNPALVYASNTGFGRTGEMFACQKAGVSPDILCVGKGLTNGCLPLAATLATQQIYEAFLGSIAEFKTFYHGHTFTGNPLGCAVARTALDVLEDENLAGRSAELGGWLMEQLGRIRHPAIKEIRGRGLLVGIELTGPARPYCEKLMELGLLAKETHEHVIRLAPPLVISRDDLAWALEQIKTVFSN